VSYQRIAVNPGVKPLGTFAVHPQGSLRSTQRKGGAGLQPAYSLLREAELLGASNDDGLGLGQLKALRRATQIVPWRASHVCEGGIAAWGLVVFA